MESIRASFHTMHWNWWPQEVVGTKGLVDSEKQISVRKKSIKCCSTQKPGPWFGRLWKSLGGTISGLLYILPPLQWLSCKRTCLFEPQICQPGEILFSQCCMQISKTKGHASRTCYRYPAKGRQKIVLELVNFSLAKCLTCGNRKMQIKI